ncbi:transcriptional regulator, TetR family [Marinobacter daqiaonensis]|uniref:Transcriptional regulator, TetR family n=1 Tax=Marinobacter daqiaonensis TaxID=650891 RepID=A0A1I6GU44_9GAMM|nr:TetR/AcrR family transcriptional regulator [Marinobacter daqiaonensis]SFR45619.1 transcriptional regulator, TetR family [Marinobacter daqiaonensis]
MKVKTRDRILSASLALFNELGEPNVTTLLISDELDISPGNLYYHFRSKGDIVGELFGHYREAMDDLLAIPDDVEVSLDQLGFFLHLLFETLERYRFLYHDLVNILTRYPELKTPFRRILKRKEAGFHTLCRSLSRQNMMSLDDPGVEALCQQLTLTVCYWESYDSLRDLGNRNGVDPGRGVYQVLYLLMPHLPGPVRDELELIARDYQ